MYYMSRACLKITMRLGWLRKCGFGMSATHFCLIAWSSGDDDIMLISLCGHNHVHHRLRGTRQISGLRPGGRGTLNFPLLLKEFVNPQRIVFVS